MKLTVYTDGASSPQKEHKMGGWGFVMWIEGDEETQIRYSDYEGDTTNQRMELMAIIRALETAEIIEEFSDVTIVSDSMYCINGITDWCHGWKKRSWHKADLSPVVNADLWKRLYDLTYNKGLVCEFKWVKGHSGDKHNDVADELATEAKKKGIILYES